MYHILNIGSESLFANRQGIDTTAHNIANAQTEGYSRQRVEITQRKPLDRHGIIIGNGVYVGNIQRSHNRLLEKQLNMAQTDKGDSETRLETLQKIGSIFSPEIDRNISAALQKFFSAWQDLSKYPEEVTVRTQLKEQAENLADTFQSVDSDLKEQRHAINEEIHQTVDKITNRVQSIAHLNKQIREMEVGVSNESNDLRDQRDRNLRELSEMIDIHYYVDKDGMTTVHGPGGTLLVERGHGATLEVTKNPQNHGLYDIQVLGFEKRSMREVTHHISGGKLNALLRVRDQSLAGVLSKVNHMADTLITQMNQIHRQGYGIGDYRGLNQVDFFKPLAPELDAAQNIQLSDAIVGSTDAIAAGSVPHSVGDNVIANQVIRLQEDRLFYDGKATLDQYYGDMVGNLGLETVRIGQLKEADAIIYADLQAKRESVSGVSLDEEASNLIRWQTAFTASSKVITTVDEMFETVLGLKR
ncbi:MAG: flagellar hook-associated protein FlgK [Zetaproteobacteria bacterium]|nr:flagellar hook-associated protein FlgK [Zetaproteobacteria bacterium]